MLERKWLRAFRDVQADSIEGSKHKTLQNVFRLDEESSTSLVVPHSDVQSLDVEMTLVQAF